MSVPTQWRYSEVYQPSASLLLPDMPHQPHLLKAHQQSTTFTTPTTKQSPTQTTTSNMSANQNEAGQGVSHAKDSSLPLKAQEAVRSPTSPSSSPHR